MSAGDIDKNSHILAAVLEHFPTKVPSTSFLRDALGELDKLGGVCTSMDSSLRDAWISQNAIIIRALVAKLRTSPTNNRFAESNVDKSTLCLWQEISTKVTDKQPPTRRRVEVPHQTSRTVH